MSVKKLLMAGILGMEKKWILTRNFQQMIYQR